MKTINILYWTFTVLFALVMASTAIPNVTGNDEANAFITALGYPDYFIPFIGMAKLLGAVGILVPGIGRLKEWAYAGLFFDLTGAVYSGIAVSGFIVEMLGMLIFFVLFGLSYYFYYKREKLLAQQTESAQSVAMS